MAEFRKMYDMVKHVDDQSRELQSLPALKMSLENDNEPTGYMPKKGALEKYFATENGRRLGENEIKRIYNKALRYHFFELMKADGHTFSDDRLVVTSRGQDFVRRAAWAGLIMNSLKKI